MLGPPDRRRMIASERSLRSELDSTVIIAHDNIVEHVRDYRSLDFFLNRSERERGVGMSRLINAVLTTLEEEGDVSLLEIPIRSFRGRAHGRVDEEQGRNTLHYHATINDHPTGNLFPFGSIHLIGFRNPQDPDSDDNESRNSVLGQIDGSQIEQPSKHQSSDHNYSRYKYSFINILFYFIFVLLIKGETSLLRHLTLHHTARPTNPTDHRQDIRYRY